MVNLKIFSNHFQSRKGQTLKPHQVKKLCIFTYEGKHWESNGSQVIHDVDDQVFPNLFQGRKVNFLQATATNDEVPSDLFQGGGSDQLQNRVAVDQ